LNNNGS